MIKQHLNGDRSLGTVSRSRYLAEKTETGRSRHFCPEIALGNTRLESAVKESRTKVGVIRNEQDEKRNIEPDLVGLRGRILTNERRQL